MLNQPVRKTKLMRRVENDYQRPLEALLPEMVNEKGFVATAHELRVHKSTLGYWMLKLGIHLWMVAMRPGETVVVKRSTE